MSDLREDLSLQAARFVPGREAYERMLRRVARRRLIRRVATGAAAIVITVVAFAGLWATSRSSVPVGSPTPTGSPMPTGSTTPSPSAAVPPEQLRIGLRTHVGGWVVLPDSFGTWVAGGGSLFDVDPTTGRVIETVHAMNWDYDYVRLAEYGEGSIWVASGGTLWEIDARSGATLREFDLSSLGTIDDVFQTSDPAVPWVTADGAHRNVLARIDPVTGRVMYQHEIGQGIHQMTEADGFLFVSSRESRNDLIRVDPVTGRTMSIPGVDPYSIAGIGHRVWVAEGGDSVRCIDAALPAADCPGIQVARATALAADGPCLPQGVGKYGECRLWVLSGTGSSSSSRYLPAPDQPAAVTLIDAATGKVLAGPIPLPDTTPATISAFDGHAWVGFHDSGNVFRIDAIR
jgi:hypothetical protein